MRFASATDYAISAAAIRGTLRIVERPSRFGGTFAAIEDHVGLIEVATDRAAAQARIDDCTRPAR